MIVDYKGGKIFYSIAGQGDAVVLLHGFLEDSSMWKNTIPLISKQKKIICIDLLGHGQSDCFGYVHTMSDMADAVLFVLNYLNITKFTCIGHSMGGYVALAIAAQTSEKLTGICLMNSTFEADDNELKSRRTRANEMVKGNFENMVRLSFSNLFSPESRINYKKEIKIATKIALQTPIQGYIAAQEGMKLRNNTFKVLAGLSCKKLIIIGKKDPVINGKTIRKYTENTEIQIKEYSEGHMSHIENLSVFLQDIVHFIE